MRFSISAIFFPSKNSLKWTTPECNALSLVSLVFSLALKSYIHSNILVFLVLWASWSKIWMVTNLRVPDCCHHSGYSVLSDQHIDFLSCPVIYSTCCSIDHCQSRFIGEKPRYASDQKYVYYFLSLRDRMGSSVRTDHLLWAIWLAFRNT